MSKRDTCEHGRPECDCPAAQHLRLQGRASKMSADLRVAFEHDFVRIEQQARAVHAFFQAGMYDEACDWLTEIINVSRGLKAALSPCEHEWRMDDDGQPYCTKACGVAQLR